MDTFSQIRTNQGELFPFPEHGERVLENPPSLVWLPDSKSEEKGYKVVVKGENNFEKTFQQRYDAAVTAAENLMDKFA